MSNERQLEHLEKEHYEEILNVENGADITGYVNARILREVEATEPSFINIVGVQGDYDGVGQLPYFGAIATKVGVIFAKRNLDRIAKEEAA